MKIFKDYIIFYLDEVKYFFYGIYYNIRNLIVWFPIIWTDRSWSSYDIYNILKFKLSLNRKGIEKYCMYKSKDEKIQQIKDCEYLISRLLEDDYFDSVECNRLKQINFKKAVEHEEYMREQDKRLLYNNLRKNMDKWYS